MFFRRRTPNRVSFEQRLERLRGSGFEIETMGEGRVKVRKNCCAAVVQHAPDTPPRVDRAGVMIGAEIAELVDGGFQKFLETPGGVRQPALASGLRALHDFQEDLREGLALKSLYHESLGTVCDRHDYDRLTGRP
jgi:hypothetical protein